MPANVETMMYTRETPWHGLGTRVEEAPNSTDALRLAGLNWTVKQTDVFTDDGHQIPNYKANYRDTDGAILGIVSDRYRVVQNADAFAFTDDLVGETENGVVKYETAGSLAGGKRIWLLAKMPKQKILDDDIEPFMCFSNTHDGSGAIKVCMTPIRVVCQNTLNIAMRRAKRTWSTKHTTNIKDRMAEAKMCLGLADDYMTALAENAEKYAETKLLQEQVDEILAQMFPVNDEKDSERKKANAEKAKREYKVCYMMPDIRQFRDTAWGAINAMSDMVTHCTPTRQTKNYKENRWGNIMDGHAMMDRFVQLVNAKVGV